MSVYQMAINNVASFIRSQSNEDKELKPQECLTAFTASHVLAIAFAKTQEDVLADLIKK